MRPGAAAVPSPMLCQPSCAPRHHAPFGLTEASPGSGCTALEKNGVVRSSSITAMSDATAASMAISTSVSFVMAT